MRRETPPPPGVPEQPGLPGMPERLFVCTPSKLAAYEDCPRRYRYAYVDRPPPPKGPPWAHNSLGASVHTALRNWYEVPAAQRGPEIVPRLLRDTWVREGYRTVTQERDVWRQAVRWLDAYVATLPAEPLGVERVVAARTPVIAFSGRADRIDRRGDELVVVDYKTGRVQPTERDAAASPALALYAFAAQRVFRRPCRQVELHHLPSGTVATAGLTEQSIDRQVRRAEQTAVDIRAAEHQVAAGGDADEAFPTTPSPLCGWCDFRRSCPAGSQWPGQEPWAAVERPPVTAADDLDT
jgi:putative RecB family exonuclease